MTSGQMPKIIQFGNIVPHVICAVLAFISCFVILGSTTEMILGIGVGVAGIGGTVLLLAILILSEKGGLCLALHIVFQIFFIGNALANFQAAPEPPFLAFIICILILVTSALVPEYKRYAKELAEYQRGQTESEQLLEEQEKSERQRKKDEERREREDWESSMRKQIDDLFK